MSNDSVTSHPSPTGSNWYRQMVSPLPTSNANSRPGMAATTVEVVAHFALRVCSCP